MTYLQKSKKGRGKIKKAVALVIVFFLIIFAVQFSAPSVFSGVTHFVAQPFWKSQNFLSERFSLFSGLLESRMKIVEKNRSLQEELAEQRVEMLYLEVLESENQELRTLLGRGESEEKLLSVILKKPPQILYDTIILDVGSTLGVEVGDLVLAKNRAAIGITEEVFRNTSQVRMFSNSGEETQAVISRNGLSVTALGRGGGNFEVQLPEEADVVSGDILVLPEFGRAILGQVIEIESHPTDASKTVFAKSPINLSKLNWVTVSR